MGPWAWPALVPDATVVVCGVVAGTPPGGGAVPGTQGLRSIYDLALLDPFQRGPFYLYAIAISDLRD